MRINLRNKWLQGISVLVILLFFIINKGCSNMKILEEDTSLKEVVNNNDVYITEINNTFNNENKAFLASYIKDGNIYGDLAQMTKGETIEDTWDIPYVLDENGAFKENILNEEWKKEYNNLERFSKWNYEGIYTNNNGELKEEVYFVNIKDEIKFLLENHKEYENIIFNNMDKQVKQTLFRDNLFLQKHMNYLSYDEKSEIYLEKSKRKNQFLLIDGNEQKEYISEVIEDMPYVFFHKKENSFMTINDKGIVYKLIVKDEKIEIEEYCTLPLSEFGLETLCTNKEAAFLSKDNILVFNFMEDLNNKVLIYDLESKRWNMYEDKKLFVRMNINNSQLFISTEGKNDFLNQIYYLERINENLEFEVIGKLLEEENYFLASAVGNEDGSQAFISFNRYTEGEGGLSKFEDAKYFYINVKNQ